MDDFRYVGHTPTTLEDGRPIAPGEFTGPIDTSDKCPYNKTLAEEGKLISAPSEQERNRAKAKAAKAEKDEQQSQPTNDGEDGDKS